MYWNQDEIICQPIKLVKCLIKSNSECLYILKRRLKKIKALSYLKGKKWINLIFKNHTIIWLS